MFLAISQFTVANGMQAKVREAFEQRPHVVDSAKGFLRMEVASPTDNEQDFWLLTWWAAEADFQNWHHGHTYKDSHAGIPKGLKLDGKRTQISRLLVFAQ